MLCFFFVVKYFTSTFVLVADCWSLSILIARIGRVDCVCLYIQYCHLIKYLNRTSAWFRSNHNESQFTHCIHCWCSCIGSVYHVQNCTTVFIRFEEIYCWLFLMNSLLFMLMDQYLFILSLLLFSSSSDSFTTLVRIPNVLIVCCKDFVYFQLFFTQFFLWLLLLLLSVDEVKSQDVSMREHILYYPYV